MMVLAAAIIVLLILSTWYLRVWYYNKGIKNVFGPQGLPIFGSVFDFSDSTIVLPRLKKFSEKYNKLFTVSIGQYPVLVVADCKYMEIVLGSTKLLRKSVFYRYLYDWLGTGLLTSWNPKWKVHRKLITPTFHFQILEQFLDVFYKNTAVFIKKLDAENGNTIDVYPLVTLLALDIICESAMGTTVNAQNDAKSDYVTSVKHMCRIVMERSFSLIENMDFTYRFTSNYRTERKALKILHDYTYSVIRSRRKLITDQTNQTESEVGIKKKTAFLDMLLQCTLPDGRKLTDEEIREEVDTFMFEGHDTTAAAMTFALYLLANNPIPQDKAFAEQEEIFADNPKLVPTIQDYNNMKYLDAIIKETLRLYPSVPFIGRKITENTHLTDDIFLKEGTSIWLSIYTMQHDPDYFDEPEKFIPERFLESNNGSKNSNAYVYCPFSAGARNCIGQKFAVLEMKSTLSRVLRNFKLSPARGYKPIVLAAETVLKSKTGVYVHLQRRQKELN